MKPLYLLFVSAVCIGQTAAQSVSGTVTTGPGYADEVWYSFENGSIHAAPAENWDLAFQISGFASSVRINGAAGTELFAAPYAVDEWSDLDTAGMAAIWPQRYNDPANWEAGAFNRHTTSDFDLGWGIYNMITHQVTGDSTYVIKLADGSFKKFRIDALAGGVYSFTYADLDGSNEMQGQVDKADYSGKNFGYYSLQSHEASDREPLSAEWDLVFTRWIDFIGPDGDVPYGVTGVLHNFNTRSSRAADTPVAEADPWSFPMQDAINTIGWDWKSFDFAQGFVIEEDLSFFVEAQNGNIYHLVFNAFEGSSTGVYAFIHDIGSALSTAETARIEPLLYPNPAACAQAVRIDAGSGVFSAVRVFDLSGKQVFAQRTAETEEAAVIPAGRLTQGTYLVHLEGDFGTAVQKLIIAN